MNNQPHAVDSRLSALETRVEGIVGTLQSVASAVGALGEKLDARGRTPWGHIWSAIGVAVSVLALVGGLAYWPVTAGLTDLKSSLLQMQDRADRQIVAMAASVVPRAEHAEHWRQDDRDFDFMRDRIGRLETRLEGRIQRLEDRALAKP